MYVSVGPQFTIPLQAGARRSIAACPSIPRHLPFPLHCRLQSLSLQPWRRLCCSSTTSRRPWPCAPPVPPSLSAFPPRALRCASSLTNLWSWPLLAPPLGCPLAPGESFASELQRQRRRRSKGRRVSTRERRGGPSLCWCRIWTAPWSWQVDHTDKAHGSLLRFNNLWAAEYAHDSLLVFSTGRSLEKYTELRSQAPLLTPALCIFSVGTEIRYGATMESDQDWEQYLNEGWDQAVVLEEVQRLNLRLQDESEIRPHKVSCQIDKKDATEVIDTLSKRLKDRGLNVKIIFSHGIDLDVLPKGAGKGEALAFLLHKMKTEGSSPRETLVCGDSGNDIELFEVEGVNGVIVGGAMEELRQWYEENGKHKDKVYQAKARCAGGIVEALGKLSLGPHLSPRDRMNSNGIQGSENAQLARSGYAQREIVEFNTFFEKWMNGEVPSDSETFQRLTSVIASGSTMVYPWGVEKGLLESVSTAQSKHGVTKDNKFRTWIDCIQEQKLGDGVYMVTWHAWQMSEGSERQGYFATAILREKEGTPNGVEWLRVHETSRKS